MLRKLEYKQTTGVYNVHIYTYLIDCQSHGEDHGSDGPSGRRSGHDGSGTSVEDVEAMMDGGAGIAGSENSESGDGEAQVRNHLFQTHTLTNVIERKVSQLLVLGHLGQTRKPQKSQVSFE